jgi:hypothetical protein
VSWGACSRIPYEGPARVGQRNRSAILPLPAQPRVEREVNPPDKRPGVGHESRRLRPAVRSILANATILCLVAMTQDGVGEQVVRPHGVVGRGAWAETGTARSVTANSEGGAVELETRRSG